MFIGTAGAVEYGGLTAVGISYQGNAPEAPGALEGPEGPGAQAPARALLGAAA